MSIRCVLTEPAFPCARTGRVDISGLHVLTFSVQVIALDDYRKSTKNFISVQFGQNLDASNSETFKRDPLGCWKQELQWKRCLCKLDRLCRQLEV